MFTAGLVLASLLSLRLACVFFVMLPLLATALVIIVRQVAPLYGALQRVMDALNDSVQESVTAIRAVKAFVRDEWVEGRFGAVNDELAATSTKTFSLAVLNLPLFQTVMYASDVLILALGGSMILAGELMVSVLTGLHELRAADYQLAHDDLQRVPPHVRAPSRASSAWARCCARSPPSRAPRAPLPPCRTAPSSSTT